MWTIFSRCFLSCKVLNVCNLLLLLLGFRKGRLLFLSGFFLCINVSLGFVGLAFTFAFLFVGVVAGLLAAVGCFGAEVFVDPLFRFGVGFLFVAGVGVSWGSKGLHAAVGVCTCMFGAVSVASWLVPSRPYLLPPSWMSPLRWVLLPSCYRVLSHSLPFPRRRLLLLALLSSHL